MTNQKEKSKSEVKLLKKIKCEHCGYEWKTKSKKKWVTCPSCQRKNKITGDEKEYIRWPRDKLEMLRFLVRKTREQYDINVTVEDVQDVFLQKGLDALEDVISNGGQVRDVKFKLGPEDVKEYIKKMERKKNENR